jgi:hypothetical protein
MHNPFSSPPFLLFTYAAHCKITHLYHELYSILANLCFRYNRKVFYIITCMSAIEGAQQSQSKQSNKTQPPRTTKKGISDVWRHVQAHRGVRVPTRDVRAYRTRSQDPLRVGPRQAGVTSRKRAPKSFYELRKIVSRVLGSPVRSHCMAGGGNLNRNGAHLQNAFFRRTHSARHRTHSTSSASSSAVETGGVPARSGSRCSRSFATC